MPKNKYNYDWSNLAFGSKKPLSSLKATFIAAPRELSTTRFKQLVKEYLPKGNIILGIAKEESVDGFEGQPQFKMLQYETIQTIIEVVNKAAQPAKIYTLAYNQRETTYIFENLDFVRIVLVNGSWKYSFHTQTPFYTLVSRHLSYEMVSPFTDEAEARAYSEQKAKLIAAKHPFKHGLYTQEQMLEQAIEVAKYSFDNSFQTGATLGRKKGDEYELLAWTYNKVVPYQAFAMHHGASREKHFSPANDLNHYDAVHAEVELLITVAKQKIDLSGASLFINLLPCPTCARMLADTEIAEVIYTLDHSSSYASSLLSSVGKVITHA